MKPPSPRAGAALVLAIALAGCAENAILELTITASDAESLGANGASRAVLDFVSADVEDTEALPTLLSPRSLELPLPAMGSTSTHRASVVASGGEVMTPLWVAIRYCDDGACDASREAPRAFVRYERAFYVGEYTRHTLVLPPLGDPPAPVGACEVFGCIEGVVGESCIEGVHYCER